METPNGSASSAKLGSNRFRTNRHREFISLSRMFSSLEFINASPKELLSGLHSKAADCMFPTENKSFELVEWFFSRYRMSTFHDEAELAASLVDEKGGKIGKRVDSNLLDNKSGKKRKDTEMDNVVKRKTKSLCGLSDNGQSKEELVVTGSNSELCISNEGLAGNSANLSLVESKASEVGTVFQEGPIGNISDNNFDVNAASEGGTISQEGLVGNITNQLKSRVEKPAEEHHQTKNVTVPAPVSTPMSAPLPPISVPVPVPMSKPIPVQVPAPVPAPEPTPVPVPMPLLPVPGEAPPPSLEFMKQQLETMTIILEISGNDLCPQVKAKLDTEIKNLLRKVNSRVKSDP